MSQHEIDLKLYRARLTKAHDKDSETITQKMLDEFDADVASGDPARSLLAHGRAQRWLYDFDAKQR